MKDGEEIFEKESQLENALGKLFLEAGFFCQKNPKIRTKGNRRHLSPLEKNGVPDLYIILEPNGRYIGVEVKLPGKVQSDDQITFETELRKRGATYFVARSIEDGHVLIKALKSLR